MNCGGLHLFFETNDELQSWAITYHYNNQMYIARFYPDDRFLLYSIPSRDDILQLDYHPDITPANFPNKLKTILVFL